MPPHLHPRSTATSTLFAGTLLASFVIVSIPHIFPCPRPRHHLSLNSINKASAIEMEIEAVMFHELEEEARQLELAAAKRECPVPKPRGMFGRVLGFKDDGGGKEDGVVSGEEIAGRR